MKQCWENIKILANIIALFLIGAVVVLIFSFSGSVCLFIVIGAVVYALVTDGMGEDKKP
jgi:hypothetical protein